ncbi:MAG: hypothetical protein IPP46_20610 [Bacteroidetes bacterium]|nr:hypothetical protein [Bacteroidota bacterium]
MNSIHLKTTHIGNPLLYYYLPILTLAICDPMAAYAGKHFPYGKFKVWGGTKSLSGLTAFFLSSLIITFSVLYSFSATGTTGSDILLLSLPLAFIGGIAEAISSKGLDNITIPVSVLLTLIALHMNRVIRMLPGDPLFHLYEQFPAKIYPADSIWLKQSQKQPGNFLEACYLYLEGEEVKCRASLYHNPLLTYEHKKSRCIGNYEAVEDDKYGLALLQQIEADAKASGSEYLIGPMNGSTWENYRFSTDHNHPNFFLEPWHPLYYNRHFLKAGFTVIESIFPAGHILNRSGRFSSKKKCI